MNKNELRKEMIYKRKELTNEEINKKTKMILENLKAKGLLEYNSFAITRPFNNEVNTDIIINYLLNEKKLIACPKTNNREMKFYKIESLNQFEIGNYNILEPNTNELMNKDDIDVILVPGVAFDYNLNRMGMGGGYYDKYLSNYKGLKVALCFDFQILKAIPHEEHDIKMDFIISNNKILKL